MDAVTHARDMAPVAAPPPPKEPVKEAAKDAPAETNSMDLDAMLQDRDAQGAQDSEQSANQAEFEETRSSFTLQSVRRKNPLFEENAGGIDI